MNLENLKDNLKITAIIIGLFLAIALPVTIAFLIANIQLPTTGITASADLLVYDLDGVTLKTDLLWGNDLGNETYTLQGIIKNNGTVSLTLNMTTDETYTWLTQTWDQEGTVLSPSSQVIATWTLTLTDAPTGSSFSYDTIIMGTET